MEKNNVNHPSHYNVEGKKECIDEMVELFGLENTISFALLNAYKYMYRDGLKDIAKDDKDKAYWYINWSLSKIIKNNLQYTPVYDLYYKILTIYQFKYYNND